MRMSFTINEAPGIVLDKALVHLLYDTARLGAKRGYDQLQDNLENLKSFKIPARF